MSNFARVYYDSCTRTIVCNECMDGPTGVYVCDCCHGAREFDVCGGHFGVYEDGSEVLISQDQYEEFISDAITDADYEEMIATMDMVNECNAAHAEPE